MPKRIRILACTFALGVGMLLLGATGAQAAPGGGGVSRAKREEMLANV